MPVSSLSFYGGRARDKELVEIEQQGGRESSWSRRDGGESRKQGRGTGRA